MVSSLGAQPLGGFRLSGTGSSVIAPPFQRSMRSARPSSWSRCTLMPTSSSRVRSSCLAVLVGGGRPPTTPRRGRRREPGSPVSLAGSGFSGAHASRRASSSSASASCCSACVPLGLQAAGDQPVVGVDGPVAALGLAGLVAGLLDLAAPLRERGVVAVLELLGGGQAGLQRGGLQRGQERAGDRGVDRDAADAQVPGAAALDELAGAGAVVAGGGLGRAVVVDGELAAAGPAGGQALQQRAALPDRAGARLVRPSGGCWRRCGPGWPGRCPSR